MIKVLFPVNYENEEFKLFPGYYENEAFKLLLNELFKTFKTLSLVL